MELEPEVVEVNASANQSDKLYVSQGNWDETKAIKIYNFFQLAFSQGFLTDRALSLKDQFSVHLAYGEDVNYQYPTLLPFKREKSNGDLEQCYIIRNGHHRIWLARALGIKLQVKIDKTLILGIIKFKPTNIEELNRIVSDRTSGALGKGFTQIYHNNLLERSIKQFIRNLDL